MDNFKCHAIISISLNIIVIICLCCEYRYIKKENDELIYNQTNLSEAVSRNIDIIDSIFEIDEESDEILSDFIYDIMEKNHYVTGYILNKECNVENDKIICNSYPNYSIDTKHYSERLDDFYDWLECDAMKCYLAE